MMSPGIIIAVGLLLLPHVSFVSGQESNMDNIALRGTCRQSPMHKYNNVPNNCTAAINNNTGTTYTADNCIRTLPAIEPPTGPFWTVQWDREHTIQQITVHARTGQLGSMRAVEVKVDNTTVYTFPADYLNINVVTQITPGLTGSKLPRSGSSVTLSRNRTGYYTILNFCEVQVWVCKPGKYGPQCSKDCGHCAGGAVCDSSSGHCPGECQQGWQPPLCDECQPGRYGPDCRHTCGRCEDGGPCNTITGHCHQCPQGLIPPLCLVPAAHHDVTCGTMDMSFFISISDLEFKPENVTLSDPRCHVHTTPSRLSGRTPLNACGTSLRLTNDSLIFSNFLILPPAAQPEGDNASVSSNLQRVIPVECHYDRVSELRLSYLPMMRQILFTETGVGQFQFHIEQFRDASFASRIADSAYPLKVTVEERVFLQLSLGESVLDEADGGKDGGPYGMEVETCVSSSSSSMMAVRNDSSQELVRDSCPANPDVRLIANSQWQNASQKSSGPHHYFRFSFKPTIDSLEDGGGKKSSSLAMGLAYIHCRVRLCAAHSCQHPVDCAPPAPSSSASGSSSGSAGRVKRAAVISELEDRERRSATGGHHLSTGPLLIMKDTDETPKSAPSPLSSPVVVALGAVAGMTTLIAVSVIVAWVLTRSRQDQYDLTTAHPCHQ